MTIFAKLSNFFAKRSNSFAERLNSFAERLNSFAEHLNSLAEVSGIISRNDFCKRHDESPDVTLNFINLFKQLSNKYSLFLCY